MNCPHCGADASAGQKFCPKCSRLVDSPLLKIKQQIDAARAEIRKDLNAARLAVSLPPEPGPQYRVAVNAPVYTPPPPPPPPPSPALYKYAPHPSQTPALTRPPAEIPRETILRSQERNQKNQRKKKQRDEGITRAQQACNLGLDFVGRHEIVGHVHAAGGDQHGPPDGDAARDRNAEHLETHQHPPDQSPM